MKGRPALEILFENAAGASVALPPRLGDWYGPLRLPRHRDRPHVVANFVATLDGVVAFESPHGGGREISGDNPDDRSVMGLLRAVADAVVVGAGTLRSVPRHLWVPERADPGLSAEFARLRQDLELPSTPLNVIVSARGQLDVSLPVFRTPGVPGLVVTTRAGERRLRKAGLPPEVGLAIGTGTGRIRAREVLAGIRRQRPKARLVLLEGGPHLIADFVAEHALDELFLTIAPQISGRATDRVRLGLVEGRTFGPEDPRWGTLASLRRGGSHLFVRYRLP
ncbi:MAG TPA: dihydrofolate reductase family protein [Thermoplasmata archaeon]|nr:dihydrofolate reductase family protein [Thermoplasmata archaeon]